MVGVEVIVGVEVEVEVDVGVEVEVGVGVAVEVGVDVDVEVEVGVDVGGSVGVGVGVGGGSYHIVSVEYLGPDGEPPKAREPLLGPSGWPELSIMVPPMPSLK